MNTNSIVDDTIDEAKAEDMGDESVQIDDTTNINRFGMIIDDELKVALEGLRTNITVVECSDAGGNTVNRMHEEGIKGAKLVAANTGMQRLVETGADTKILVGEQETQGRDAGPLPQIDEGTVLGSQEEIYDVIGSSNVVLVITGLGGGTGTGSVPTVAKAVRESGTLTIAVVTTPFMAEGEARRTNAEAGLERLRDASDTVIVVPNDRLLDTVDKLPARQAFRVSDGVLMHSVKGIAGLIIRPGLVSLNFADVKTVMERGDIAMIGFGKSDSESRAQESVKSTLRLLLLDVDISGVNSVLVNATGGSDTSIEGVEGVVEEIYNRIDPDACTIWGIFVDDELEGMMRAMIVVTSVESPRIYDRNDETQAHTEKHLEDIGYTE